MKPDLDAQAYKRERLPFRDSQCPCFWCERLLGRFGATVEHLVPKGRGGTSSRKNLEIACHECQKDRSAITQLACTLQALMAKLAQKRIDCTEWIAGWLKRRAFLLKLMLKFETLYLAKLKGSTLKGCLAELDYILSADPRMEHAGK